MKSIIIILVLIAVMTPSAVVHAANPHGLTATLALTGTSVQNSVVGVTGCGYTPDSSIGLILIGPGGSLKSGGFAWWGTASDSSGCISTEAWITIVGEYELQAYDGQLPNGRNRQVAELFFTVE